VGAGIAHLYFVFNLLAVNKEELMETITMGAEKIINTNDESRVCPSCIMCLSTPNLYYTSL
jgi:hypothetical protein